MINQSVSNIKWNQMLCLNSSAKATIDCVRSFSETDFRNDLKNQHSCVNYSWRADETVPIDVSETKQLHYFLKQNT
jgi:hypothetical protein